jgi:hypothetical protein
LPFDYAQRLLAISVWTLCKLSRLLTHYSAWARAGLLWNRDSIPGRVRDFPLLHSIQTGPGVHRPPVHCMLEAVLPARSGQVMKPRLRPLDAVPSSWHRDIFNFKYELLIEAMVGSGQGFRWRIRHSIGIVFMTLLKSL